jgi:hypothetical protein
MKVESLSLESYRVSSPTAKKVKVLNGKNSFRRVLNKGKTRKVVSESRERGEVGEERRS